MADAEEVAKARAEMVDAVNGMEESAVGIGYTA